jgi:hypothetical protein
MPKPMFFAARRDLGERQGGTAAHGRSRIENVAMADLTAAEVQALAALADNHPMTVDELARSVSDAACTLSPPRSQP